MENLGEMVTKRNADVEPLHKQAENTTMNPDRIPRPSPFRQKPSPIISKPTESKARKSKAKKKGRRLESDRSQKERLGLMK